MLTFVFVLCCDVEMPFDTFDTNSQTNHHVPITIASIDIILGIALGLFEREMADMEAFRAQLEQVEAALMLDPANDELLKLKADIQVSFIR